MTIKAEVIAHSLHPSKTSFIATLRLVYPKYVHSHVLTHKALAKNTASARAIPTRSFRRAVLADPAMPSFWGVAGKGMSAHGALSPTRTKVMRGFSFVLMYVACLFHFLGEKLGGSKETLNRWLEPWAHVVVVVSGSDSSWSNFLALRDHPAADPTTQALARAVRDALDASRPKPLSIGGWHLPFAESTKLKTAVTQSVARCARTSYAVPDRPTSHSKPHEDEDLYQRLLGPPCHASPFEHQAIAVPMTALGGLHFGSGWQCLRSTLPDGGTCPNRFRDEDGLIK